MAEHKHGDMDVTVQQKTFEGFIKWITWSSICIIGFLIFLALVNA